MICTYSKDCLTVRFAGETIGISIYTLSDLGDLSNLIGSLCELGVFPIFLENDLLQVDKILGLTFFKARKDFEDFNSPEGSAPHDVFYGYT